MGLLRVKAISIQWTGEVEPWEAETVVSTLAHIQEIIMVLGRCAGFSISRGQLRPFGTWVLQDAPENSPYSSTLWYVQQSLDSNTGQISGQRFLEVIRQEPWQQASPHHDLAVVHQDLVDSPIGNPVDESDPYVLSSFVPDLGAVLSVRRLRTLQNEVQRRQALRRLTLSAFGQVLQLPGPTRTENVIEIQGARWCANRCVLRHAADTATMLNLAVEEENERTIFCPQCTNDLLDHTVATHFSPN